MDKPFRRRDLLGIRHLSAEEIVGILNEIIKVMLKEYDDEEAVWIYEKP